MERPINLKAHEVRGILDGRQNQLRRIINPQPWLQQASTTPEHADIWCVWKHPRLQRGPGTCGQVPAIQNHLIERCPFGQVGDRLWGRETTYADYDTADGAGVTLSKYGDGEHVLYAGCNDENYNGSIAHWDFPLDTRPSVCMPRWASRILLEIVSVRVEGLRDISEADAEAQGIIPVPSEPARIGFMRFWDEVHGKCVHSSSPWVWVIEFKRVDGV